MSTGLWLVLIGLIFVVIAFMNMLKVRTYTFKNKKVLLQERLVFFAAGLGFIILLFVLIRAIFF